MLFFCKDFVCFCFSLFYFVHFSSIKLFRCNFNWLRLLYNRKWLWWLQTFCLWNFFFQYWLLYSINLLYRFLQKFFKILIFLWFFCLFSIVVFSFLNNTFSNLHCFRCSLVLCIFLSRLSFGKINVFLHFFIKFLFSQFFHNNGILLQYPLALFLRFLLFNFLLFLKFFLFIFIIYFLFSFFFLLFLLFFFFFFFF